MSRILTVPPLSQPMRLDKFLHSVLPHYSRAQLQRAIRQGQVTVNNTQVTVHHWLRSGDTVELNNLPTEPVVPLVKPNPAVNFTVLADTSDYLVIDKPAGLVVHPAPGISEPTLIDGVLARYPAIKEVGDNPLRPGLVHRLDRDVSGVLVIAKNQAMFNHLKNQFMARRVDKEYLGLVVGKISQPSGTIKFPLARSKRHHGKIAARALGDAKAREAITHYTVVKVYQQVTLLKLKLETGRTHQIRAHLAALGHPLVGDTLYRPARLTFKSHPGRIFLHAHSLTFADLNNQYQTFISPLPSELVNFLKTLL